MKAFTILYFFVFIFTFDRIMGCTRGQPYLTPTKYPQMDSNPVTLKGEGGLSCSPLEAYYKLFWHFEIQITKWILRMRWIYLLIFLFTLQKVHNWKKKKQFRAVLTWQILFPQKIQDSRCPEQCIKRGTRFLHSICHCQRKDLIRSFRISSSPQVPTTSYSNGKPS